MTRPPFNVLFLCTGNSARSIMAEALLNHWGAPKLRGYSAGSHPKGEVHPQTIRLLQSLGLPTAELHSKGWDRFAEPGAPVMDFVFTVCDQAAGEVCPVWPGQPVTAHWGLPDPAAVAGPPQAQERAFRETLLALDNRIKLFVALPFAALDRIALTRRVRSIGRLRPDAAEDVAS